MYFKPHFKRAGAIYDYVQATVKRQKNQIIINQFSCETIPMNTSPAHRNSLNPKRKGKEDRLL